MPKLKAFKADAVKCPLHNRTILVRSCNECKQSFGIMYYGNETYSHCLFLRESPEEQPTIPGYNTNEPMQESELIEYGSK